MSKGIHEFSAMERVVPNTHIVQSSTVHEDEIILFVLGKFALDVKLALVKSTFTSHGLIYAD